MSLFLLLSCIQAIASQNASGQTPLIGIAPGQTVNGSLHLCAGYLGKA